MADFIQQVPRGRGVKKQRVGGVYVKGLVNQYRVSGGVISLVASFSLTLLEQWQRLSYTYDWWREIKDKQIIVKSDKRHKGKVFYDEGLDDKLGGEIQTLG